MSPAAGAQPVKGSQAGLNGSPDQHYYPHPPSQPDIHNSYGRDRSMTRGRAGGVPVPHLSIQSQSVIPGRAISPRSNANTSQPPSRPGTSGQGSVERKRSVNQGHNKQTSLMHGPSQHSRDNSLAASSPAYSHKSPQMTSPGQSMSGFDGMGYSALPLVEGYEYRSPATTASSTVGSGGNGFSHNSNLAASSNGDVAYTPESDRTRGPFASPPSRHDRGPRP